MTELKNNWEVAIIVGRGLHNNIEDELVVRRAIELFGQLHRNTVELRDDPQNPGVIHIRRIGQYDRNLILNHRITYAMNPTRGASHWNIVPAMQPTQPMPPQLPLDVPQHAQPNTTNIPLPLRMLYIFSPNSH